MTKPQSRTHQDRPTHNGVLPDAAAPQVEKARDIAATAADAVVESVRAGQATTTGVLREWVDSLTALPFTVLARGDVGPIVSGRIWLDGTFEMVDALWTVHRRVVDEVLAVQRKTAAQLVDSGWALAAGTGAAARRSRAAEPPHADAARP